MAEPVPRLGRTLERDAQRARWRAKYRKGVEKVDRETLRAEWRAKYRKRHGPPTRYDGSRRVPDAAHATHCGHCGVPIDLAKANHYRPRKYCSRLCSARAGGKARDRQATTPNRRNRRERDRETIGLTPHRRMRLLARWRQQGRACTYCPRPATTIDHVVPLIRGGTNFEGNLAPCCRPCNSSKGPQLLVEWRSRTSQHRRPAA